ncbi:cytochrome P450 [Streptomyces sp. NBC_00178]|uniref:cytochrome P450 n=1 Tax=Streptomyces sp. NBC_00178 TaxID=2975672 RepID=UPI002E2D85D9|nr:cytochrome P450 [Streptomyces sp. NBC_00178]
MADRHATYAWLRDNRPVAPIALPGGDRAWLITRYDDVRAGLSDPQLSNDQNRLALPTPFDVLPAHIRSAVITDVQNVDPPQHSRLRGLLAPLFSPSQAAARRPRLQSLADELIDSLADRNTVDLVADFAMPFAAGSLAEILGIPLAESAHFQRIANAVVSAIHGGAPDDLAAAALEQHAYVADLIARTASAPESGLVSDLVRAHQDGELSAEEMSSTIFGLLIAGQEGTANLIASGMHLLLTHPEQLAKLRKDAGLITSAVDEFARYSTPLDLPIFRSCPRDVEFSGGTVPANEPIMFSLASSGRDGARFDRPDDVDITRVDTQHLAFGRGVHFCPGARFGRVQAEVAIGTLVARCAEGMALEPDGVEWQRSTVTRALRSLSVHLS